jgi:hypothetical protein
MSNVLPAEKRKAVWRLYRSHFIIVGSTIALLCALAAFVALLPSYLVLRIDETNPAALQQTGQAAAGTKEDRAAVAYAQAFIATLSPVLSTSTPTDAVQAALAARPRDVAVDHITLTSGPPGTLIISGKASRAEEISVYQNALRGTGRFSSVSVPVSDLAGTDNGQFTATLSGSF